MINNQSILSTPSTPVDQLPTLQKRPLCKIHPDTIEQSNVSLIQKRLLTNTVSKSKSKQSSPKHTLLLNQPSQKKSAQTATTIEVRTIVKEPMIEQMSKEGSEALLNVLCKQDNKLWSEVKKLPSNALIDQMIHIYLLCEKLQSKPQDTTQLLEFCLEIVKREGLIISTSQLLPAKILLLLDRDPASTFALIIREDLQKTINAIETSCQTHLDSILHRLRENEKKHLMTGLQNSQRAYAEHLPVELAKMMITSIGRINVGIIPLLIKKFLPIDRTKLPYESNIAYVLSELAESSSLRSRIEQIKKPSNSTSPSNYLIRISLDIPSGSPVTRIDTQRTALAALLSHLRQGDAGSCFATHICIHMLSCNLEECLEDFDELLHRSRLTREINGHRVEFPFLMRISRDSDEREITIDKRGRISNPSSIPYPAWEFPGILSALKAMGITKIKSSLTRVLPLLFPRSRNETDSIKISIRQFFSLLIKSHKHLHEQNSALLDHAILAFEAETHNPLLHMWENSIAGMAEADRSGVLKHSLVNSIFKSIKGILGIISFPIEIENEFLKNVCTNVIQYSQWQYDPYYHDAIVQHEHYNNGAFVLYDRRGLNPLHWRRIENARDFQNFVERIIKESASILVPQCIKCLKEGVMELCLQVHENTFLESVLHSYSNKNQNDVQLIEHIHRLKHTPWLDNSGNVPKAVMQVYFGKQNYELQSPKEISPKTATELLEWIINIGKTSRESLKYNLERNPRQRLPISIHGLHAFSLLLGNSKLSLAWNTNSSVPDWIEKNIIGPGKAIANAQITTETRDKLVKYINSNFINPANQAKFTQLSSSLGRLTVSQFRAALIEIIRIHSIITPTKLIQISRYIDTFLFQEGLPTNDRRALYKSIIPFVDSNWQHCLHDIFFCFVFNPGSGQLEVWEILEDGTGLTALSQAKWVTNKKWEYIPFSSKIFYV